MHQLQEKILALAKKEQISKKTLREIGLKIGEEHPQKIKHHLTQLINKGFLQIDENGNYFVVEKGPNKTTDSLISIPILGSANCGPAVLYANECLEGYLKISKTLVPKNHDLFILRADGMSLNKASINGSSIEDGDYLVIDRSNKDIHNGDYVLSIIDGVANVKKYYYDSQTNSVSLISESTYNIPPILIDPHESNYYVNGKVIRIIKTPKI